MMHNQPTSYRQYLRGACLALAASTGITGCVQLYPIPYAARAGDTIVLGLGGVQRNANGEQNVEPNDLAITLTDHGGHPYSLQAAYTFKAYPDYASFLNYGAVKGDIQATPFDGGWFAVVPLVDESSGEALPLVTGAGTVKIESDKIANFVGEGEGDLLSIPIEILSGVSDPDKTIQFKAQFAGYTTRGVTLSVAPGSLTGVTSVGGLQLAITYPQSSTYLDPDHPPMVVPYSHNPYIQISQNIVSNSNGTNTINVLMTAQKGFSSAAGQTAFTPSLNDLALQIMYFTGTTSNDASVEQLLDDFKIDSGYYVDLNGHVMTLQPELAAHQW